MFSRFNLFVLMSLGLHAGGLAYYGQKGSEVLVERARGGASIELGGLISSRASVAEEEEKVKPREIKKSNEVVEPVKPVEMNETALLPVPAPKKELKKPKKKKKLKVRKKNSIAQKKGAARRSFGSKRARSPGAGGRQNRVSGRANITNYRGRVYARIRSRRFRPRGGGRGTAIVRFTVRRSGGAAGIRLVRSSGRPSLDRAAVSIVRRASPFPHFPAGLYAKSLSFSIPISFR